jgi:hypothetical protein
MKLTLTEVLCVLVIHGVTSFTTRLNGSSFVGRSGSMSQSTLGENIDRCSSEEYVNSQSNLMYSMLFMQRQLNRENIILARACR